MQQIFPEGYKFYKVVNSLLGLDNFHHYKMGYNQYKYKKGESLSKNDGMFFTDLEHVFAYVNYGPIIIEAELVPGSRVKECPEKITENGVYMPGYVIDKVNVVSMIEINSHNVKALVNKGADPRVSNYRLFMWAYLHSFDIWSTLLGDSTKYVTEYDMLQIGKLIAEYNGLLLKENNNEQAV